MTLYEHSLKNAYIGEYPYTIDLKNTSQQAIMNKGWNVYKESDTSYDTSLTYNADGICNGFVYKEVDISSASKVIISAYVYCKKVDWGGLSVCKITGTVGTGTQYSGMVGGISSTSSEGLYVCFNDGTKTSAGSVNTGWYTVTMTVDLSTGVVKATNGTLTATKTLSSSELATLNTYRYLGASAYGWSTNIQGNRVQNITVAVEY